MNKSLQIEKLWSITTQIEIHEHILKTLIMDNNTHTTYTDTTKKLTHKNPNTHTHFTVSTNTLTQTLHEQMFIKAHYALKRCHNQP